MSLVRLCARQGVRFTLLRCSESFIGWRFQFRTFDCVFWWRRSMSLVVCFEVTSPPSLQHHIVTCHYDVLSQSACGWVDVSKAGYFRTRALRHGRPSLPDDVAKTVACSIVGSRLEYCNSQFAGLSTSNLNKLQRVQNTLVRCCTTSHQVQPYFVWTTLVTTASQTTCFIQSSSYYI